ncbi:MAG: UDP-3-O-(3-hydroxymyristoyl)glucosamine N-acyltransferase, partial [Geminicoccaceae bacterium]|nr:UDP-3-O-(3-hydroxymyristoyl)glucosamine N-acyltransferase [Geminicoccaceae bacterium]
MADPRFFHNQGPFKLAALASMVDAELRAADPETEVLDLASLDQAGPEHLTFLDNPKYAHQAQTARAAACLIRAGQADLLPDQVGRLIVADPYRAWARIAAAFYPAALGSGAIAMRGEADAGFVDATAALGEGAVVEPGAVVGERAGLGRGVRIGANAVVGAGVEIGEDSVVGPGATLSHCLIGARVVIHPGVRIGQDGFGFALGADGHLKVPQLGRVLVEDDVEIGANSTIDRGSGPDTVIGRGSKIDNLVMIAHNVVLGEGCVIVAQSGISGSTRIG